MFPVLGLIGGGSLKPKFKLNISHQQQLISKAGYKGGDVVVNSISNLSPSVWVDVSNMPQYQGIPSFWLNHPNKYSGGKSQIVMYGQYQDFQSSDFYKQYGTKLITIPPPPQFARNLIGEVDNSQSMGRANSNNYIDEIVINYGQKWRIIFLQGDMTGVLNTSTDFYLYYIDSAGQDDYFNMLNLFYQDRDILQPIEVIAMLHIEYEQNLEAIQQQMQERAYNEGAQAQAQQDAEEQSQQAKQETQEENSSDVWGAIGHIAEIGAMFF